MFIELHLNLNIRQIVIFSLFYCKNKILFIIPQINSQIALNCLKMSYLTLKEELNDSQSFSVVLMQEMRPNQKSAHPSVIYAVKFLFLLH